MAHQVPSPNENDENWRQSCYDRIKGLIKEKQFSSSCEDPPSQPRSLQEDVFGEKNYVDFELQKAVQNGNVDKFLDVLEKVSSERKLEVSAIFDQETHAGDSLLHEAAHFGREKIAELIGHYFPKLLTKANKKGDTALHVAAKAKSRDVIKLILSQYNAEKSKSCAENKEEGIARMTNKYGNTALHEAVSSKEVEGVTALLEADKSVARYLNKSSKSPLYLAVMSGDKKIVDIMLEASFPDDEPFPKCHGNSPLHAAIYTKNAALMKEILKEKPGLMYSTDEDGGTPLHYAAARGYVEGASILLKKSDLTALVHNTKGHLPIHLACKWGHVEMVKELLKQKWADDSRVYVNTRGQNVLHVAAKNGQHKVVNYVLKNTKVKYIINEKDEDGNTPLHLASQNPFPSIVFSLTREKEIDVNIMNNEGLTARDTLWLQNEEKTLTRALWLSNMLMDSVGALGSDKALSMIRKRRAIQVNWAKDKADTLMLVAILIATVTFAAGFTVPGSVYSSEYPNPHRRGMAVLGNRVLFWVYVLSDTAAMFCSIFGAIFLLWAQHGDFHLAERSFMLAFRVVGLALAFMSWAFLAAVSLVVTKNSLFANQVTAIIGLIFYFFIVYFYLIGLFPLSFLFPIPRLLSNSIISSSILLYGTPPKVKLNKLKNSASQHAVTEKHWCYN